MSRRLDVSGAARWLAGLLAATAVMVSVGARATPVTCQGTLETTLTARDINGNPLASLLASNAVRFYETVPAT